MHSWATVSQLLTAFSCFIQLWIQHADLFNPLQESDILWTYSVANLYHCRRLCWYRKLCARYSFYMNGHPGDSGARNGPDNCVLHLTDSQGHALMPGWISAGASNDGLVPGHCCATKVCSETEICLPVRGRGQQTVCADASKEFSPCVSNPCQNGGTCTHKENAYTCDCVSTFTGDQCQTALTPCQSNPCQNDGSCTETGDTYTCLCPRQFIGSNCQTETWLYRACNVDADCVETKAGCFSGKCLCSDGYYFSNSNLSCVRNCHSLQNSYLHYEMWDLTGHDQYAQVVQDHDDCKSLCNNDDQCLVVVFARTNNKCFIKHVTPQDVPNVWRQLDVADTFQRTCE